MANEKASDEKKTVLPLVNVPKQFPYTKEDEDRLQNYHYYEQLFLGEHYEAFKVRVSSNDFNKAYSKIRYVMVNFAGMISKIVADMLFGEPLAAKFENKDQQSWIEDFWHENNLDILLYESALTNSFMGDCLFKLRVGQRYEKDKKSSVIWDTPSSALYFPHIDRFNVTGEPKERELAWTYELNGKTYLRREIQSAGKIVNEAYLMKGNEIKNKVSLTEAGLAGIKDVEETKIDRNLLIHIPNWKAGTRWNGISDYFDLDTLFFAVNNRMSKIDNILDKHSDPILMVPPGVLDENGKVKKQDGRVIEIGEGDDGKPEYVVWDASLENAFKEIEKLVDFVYMVGEVSPDVLGLGKGQSDSGRALKFKLMRTLAKVNRKKRYYDRAIKEALYVAQLLAKEYDCYAGGKPFPGEPVIPDLEWQDGLPADEMEQIDIETKAIDAGITSPKDSMMRVYNMDEEAAEKKIKEIDEKKKADLPAMNLGGANPFDKNNKNPVKSPVDPKAKPEPKPPANKK